MTSFCGPDQAIIHHREFGGLADAAASHLLGLLAARGLNGRVIDLGCGSGLLARRLVDAGYDVTGFDLSESMVTLAREHAPRATFTAVALLDAELPTGCVAVAATGEVLNYGTDPPRRSRRRGTARSACPCGSCPAVYGCLTWPRRAEAARPAESRSSTAMTTGASAW